MNLALFFEGTGLGVRGRKTNVSLVYEACLEDDAQRRHLEAGPGAHVATPGLAVSETCPPNVRFARHAVAEHEARRFCVPRAASSRRQCGGTM